MAATLCDNCGAPLFAEARFCRQCGKPQASPMTDGARLEAPTQTLGAREAVAAAAPTERWQSSPTTPAYLAPQSNMPAAETAPAATRSLQPQGNKSRFSLALLAALFLCILFALVAAGFVLNRLLSPIMRETAVRINKPEPPSPSSAPNTKGSAAIDSSLFYPGAQKTMDVKDGEDSNVVQLQTTDASDKVAEWYTARLKPKTVFRQKNMPTVLSNETVTVVLTPQDGGTDILITKENK